jgi:hypothetical protein
MTKDGLNDIEKATLRGIGAVLNLDICDSFQCPYDGCDVCPLRKVCEAQEKMIAEIDNLVGEMGW